MDLPDFDAILSPGDIVFVDDGLLALEVLETSNGRTRTVAQNNVILGENKGVNLPNVSVPLPAVSEKDRGDLQFAREAGVDFVFASFIRQASHVHEIRGLVGPDISIISKLESQEGIENFDEINEASDGIMVARGDLGIEIGSDKVFLAQKSMITRANLIGKPVICATQMLESMCYNPRPTRAECVDVANAVLDGSDCVMLSGETAKGKHPEAAIRTMGRICQEAEAAVDYETTHRQICDFGDDAEMGTQEAAAISAVDAAFRVDACAILVCAETGSAVSSALVLLCCVLHLVVCEPRNFGVTISHSDTSPPP